MQAQPTYASIEKFEFESHRHSMMKTVTTKNMTEAVALVGELGQASISLVQRFT